MPQISINQKQIEITLNSNATLNDVVNKILDDKEFEKNILTDIVADGKNLDLTNASEFDHVITQFDNIEITLKSDLELAYHALDSCSYYIDVVIDKIQKIVVLYSDNQIAMANANFSEVLEIMDLFIQLMIKINRTLRSYSIDQALKNTQLQKLEIHLLSILKALIPAKEKNDIIMLCDLLEYELVDNLKQWKINAIPELKKIRTN